MKQNPKSDFFILFILKRILLLFIYTCVTFVALNLSIEGLAQTRQTQWNDIKIYHDINYCQYQDDITEANKDQQNNVHLLDIYQPDHCNLCPVMIYIHGGTWVLGDKGGLSYKAKAFTDHDYIYISINYRLSPDVQFPAHARDVARAFDWVKKNISDYGGDPDRIYLIGHSAGGHLAALITLNDHYLAELDLLPTDIAGIIGLDSAAYHLPSLFAAEPENQYLFEWAFGDDPQKWEQASPICYIREGLQVPPFLLLVAGDRQVSKTVNQEFYQQLQQHGYNAALFDFPGEGHVSIDYDLGKENDQVFPIILDWLNQQIQISNNQN